MSKPMTVMRYRPEYNNRLYRKKHRIKLFLLVFGVIAGVALFTTSLVYMIKDIQNLTGSDVQSGTADDEVKYTASDSFDIAILGVSYEGSLEYVTITGYSPAQGNVTVCTLSDTASIEGLTDGTLGDIYALYGTEGIKNTVEKITGHELYGTMTLDFSGTTKFYDLFGGCKVALDQNITYITQESVMGIIAAKGERKFSGRELVRLFSYRGWENGEYDRCAFISRAVAALIDENISGGTAARYSGYYSGVVNKISTDISAVEFGKINNKIYYLARCNAMGQGISYVYKITPPQEAEGETEFEISEETLKNIRLLYAQ